MRGATEETVWRLLENGGPRLAPAARGDAAGTDESRDTDSEPPDPLDDAE